MALKSIKITIAAMIKILWDKKLFDRFKISFGCEVSEKDMKRYKREIDELFYEYIDRQPG